MINILLLVLLAEILTAAGQIFLKTAANDLESHDLKRIGAHVNFLLDVFSKPALWTGFAFMSLGLVAWLFALAQGDLSLVFSLGSSQYVIILFLAHFILGEKIDRMKVLGTFLVVLGITFIAMSH
ncbi:MAG: EamA family transporter [Candidatus Omnitrophica bacterium]|nr:EamA family transporter [Candidatus Omnitrophota bacterium]